MSGGITHTWVALLRGINVGKAKRVSMVDLAEAIESLGYSSVKTLLASGNVVFTSRRPVPARAADQMQAALLKRTGVSSRFTLLSAGEFASAVDGNPITGVEDPSRLFVVFPRDGEAMAALRGVARRDWAGERAVAGRVAAYVHCPAGLSRSRAMEAVAKELSDGVTVRNWATASKLLELVRATAKA